MRKTIATALAVALGVVGVLTAPTALAGDTADRPTSAESAKAPAPQAPALATARRVVQGEALAGDPSVTLALRDLSLARPSLRGAERRQADALLARPSDGFGDPVGFGYPDPTIVTKQCNTRLCVHYVPTGPDAPPSVDWVSHTLAVMDQVWTSQVDTMGFRPPVSDQGRGGTAQFDVYLKDLGGQIYGFCATEKRRVKGRTTFGYCVLDNSFGPEKFPTSTPDGNLRVTAAHEFFHAIQYAYDFREDPWMMESTATWIEERFANDVNDNRQYLPASQLHQPQVPLDMFLQGHPVQYGNWIFWEYLSNRYSTNIVRRTWEVASKPRREGTLYSLQALRKVLGRKGGLPKVYSEYAAANLVPAITYPEGSTYGDPRPRRARRLSRKRRSVSFSTRIHHMASTSFRFRSHSSLAGKRWKLRIGVSGPARRTSPAAMVLIHRTDGTVSRRKVRLNRKGRGATRLPFSSRSVTAVSVTLVNASTRMRCNRGTLMACFGESPDNALKFRVTARAVKR
jgi:hypothetical protein